MHWAQRRKGSLFPATSQLPELERKSSIEALEDLSSALKSTPAAESLDALRRSSSVSKLHRIARFLRLHNSPPRDPSDPTENPLETEDFSLEEAAAAPMEALGSLSHREGSGVSSATTHGERWATVAETGLLLSSCRELRAHCIAKNQNVITSSDPAEADASPQQRGLLLGLDQCHGMPFSWHLAHEMCVNDDFAFKTDGKVTEDNFAVLGQDSSQSKNKMMRIIVLAVKKSREDAIGLALGLVMNPESGEADAVLEAEKKLQQLIEQIAEATCLAIIERVPQLEGGVKSALDSALIIQMLRNGSYSPQSFAELLQVVVGAVVEGSMCPSILSQFIDWKEETLATISAVCSGAELLQVVPRVLVELVHHLKQARVDELNVKMKLFFPVFKRQFPNYERECVMEALESKKMGIATTTAWLDEAKTCLMTNGAAHDTSSVHLHAFIMLVCGHEAPIPESLLFDQQRVTDMRDGLRALVFVQCFYVIIARFLGSFGIVLNKEEVVDTKQALVDIMAETRAVRHAATRTCDMAHAMAIKRGKETLGPRPEKLVKALRRSTKDADGSIRRVYTRRIQSYLKHNSVSEEPFDFKAAGMVMIQAELEMIAHKFKQVYTHNDMVYQPMFTSILHSGHA